MGILKRVFGRGSKPPPSVSDDAPFMEHPTGEFPNAVAAMTSAIERLRSLDTWGQWITFSAQGAGTRPESYHIVDIRMLGDVIDLGNNPIDVRVLKDTELEVSGLNIELRHDGTIRIPNADPFQLASVLDRLFCSQLGIRPFEGESDYAVGAEW